MKKKNTQTTKKYAIDVIEELRVTAKAKIGDCSEPDEDQFKLKAIKNGTAVFKSEPAIRKAAARVIKESHYGHHVEITELVETPAAHTKAMAEYDKAKPGRDKVLYQIDSAYETAERTIMLGGSDTIIGEAIAKLEKALKQWTS